MVAHRYCYFCMMMPTKESIFLVKSDKWGDQLQQCGIYQPMEYTTSAANETTVISAMTSGRLVSNFVITTSLLEELVIEGIDKATKNIETKFRYMNRPQSIAITDKARVPKILHDIARRAIGWFANSLSLLRKGMKAMDARVKHQR